MSRPTKGEFLAAIRRERAALDAIIASVPRERLSEPSLEGDRSVKDVLAHISAWEKICLALVRNNTPIDPPSGATQPSSDVINDKIYENNRDAPFEEVAAEARSSYADLLALVESLSYEQLDAVIGGVSEGPRVAEVIGGNGDGHYREHNEQIERWLNAS